MTWRRGPAARSSVRPSVRHGLRRGGRAAGLLAGCLLVAPPALAHDDAVRSGGCSSTAHWKLRASPEDGRIEVEAEVHSGHAGQSWRWRIRHNGDVSATGTATTRGSGGVIHVRRRMADLWHDDHFELRAVDAESGQVCHGRVGL